MSTECNEGAETLYRIGIFSRMNQVTIKALRYYDEADLLKPRYVDSENGYRYYSSSQLPTLHQLLALRKIGFSIEEIRRIQQGEDEKKLLAYKKQQILQEIAQRTQMLSQLEGYLQNEDQNNHYHVVIKELPEVIVASMRQKIDNYGELFSFVPKMGQEMEKIGCECAVPEYCFNMYHDGEYREEDIDAEICEAVVKKYPDTDAVKFKTIPKVKMAACAVHKGSYEGFPRAYSEIIHFIETNGYEIAGLPRESYIDGIWNRSNPAEWLTEIQFPIQVKDTQASIL